MTIGARKKIIEKQKLARQKGFSTLAKRRNLVKNSILKNSKFTLGQITLTPALAKLLSSLFIWTEGEKGDFGRMGFTNSDPQMVGTFLFLLRKSFYLDESKFRVLVHLHEYHNEKSVLNFWSEATKIPLKQFTKSYLKLHTKKRVREDYMGCIRISYYDYKIARELASIYTMFASQILGL